jgi:tetratricopeptide (TPR) repeat protein
MRNFLVSNLLTALVDAGEMAKARELVDDTQELIGPGPTRVQIALGGWEQAERRLRETVQRANPDDDFMTNRGPTELLGEFLLAARRYDEAEECLRRVVEIDTRCGARAWDLRARAKLARLLASTTRADEARAHLDWVAAVMAEGEDWGGTAGLVALARGVVASAGKNWQEAEPAFDEALTIARKYGLPWDEADALHERARMYISRDEKGHRKQALQLLDETAAIYQRLGAKKHLEFVIADKLAAQGIESSDIHTSIDRVAAAVQSEHPDLKPHAAPDGTVTIMFSDIEGSTEKTVRLGDEVWMTVLGEHNTIVRRQIKAHAGFEVKSEGDGFMVAFQSARKALDCAIAIQQSLVERNRGVGAEQQPAEVSKSEPLGARAQPPTTAAPHE